MKTDALLLTAEREVQIHEVDVPEIAGDEILVECVANGICMLEVSLFRGTEKSPLPLPPGP